MPTFIELRFLAPCRRHVRHPKAAGFRQRCCVLFARAVHRLALCLETEGRGKVRLPQRKRYVSHRKTVFDHH